MRVSKSVALGLVWVTGMATIVGSSLKEEGTPPLPPVPVTVRYDLTSASLERALETRTAVLSGLQLGGAYSANQGATLTLDRTSVAVNSSSSFTLTINGSGSELLVGTSDVQVTANLDVGLAHNPISGQFSSDFSGTTTLVTVTSTGVDVLIGGSTTPNRYSWSGFEAVENDTAVVSLDLRMASAVYNMFDVVLRATRLTEDIINDIQTNKTMLESIGTNSPLTLTSACDNSTSTNDVRQTMFWSTDPTGAGQGVVGDGDAFELRYRNCQDASRAHYLTGTVDLSNYDAADTVGLSTLAIKADLGNLFLSNTDSDPDLVTPAATSPRFNGELSLRYQEQSITR